MKINVQKTGLQKSQSVAILSHGDKRLEWNIKFIDKANLAEDVDIFEQINAFWQTLPAEQQDKIFDVYNRTLNVLRTCWINNDLGGLLTPLINELVNLHDMEKIRYWMDYQSNLQLPMRLDEKFVEQQQSSYTRDKTYLKEDYKQLVMLSIAIRPMIPIWGEFLYKTEDDSGTQWKEYYAYLLLEQTSLMKTEPMIKLLTYVDRNVGGDKANPVSVLNGGISTDDFPDWVTGLVVVRRLGFGDIRGVNPNIHLVTQISGFINTIMGGQESRFKSAGMIKPKIIEGQGSSDSESNLSKLEGVKVKEAVPSGNIVPIDVFTDDIKKVAKRICPSLDMALLRASAESVKQLYNEEINPIQRSLVLLLCSREISTKGGMYLDHIKLIKLIAIAQAVFWHNGFHDLALLVSAISKGRVGISNLEGRARIPPAQMDRLNVLYPHPRRPPGKKSDKGKNPAVIAIELMEVEFSSYQWRPTIPKEWLDQLQNQNNQTYYVPYEIKIKLAEFAIALASKEL